MWTIRQNGLGRPLLGKGLDVAFVIRYENRFKEEIGVTVCIAAIADENIVVGAADRMLSAQDVEFEPPISKIKRLTKSICLMTAGDSAVQTSIINDLYRMIGDEAETRGADGWLVQEIADAYVRFYNYEKLKRAESAVLSPLGLDKNTFIDRQQLLSERLVGDITRELINYELPPTETIIVGVDNRQSAHIYVATGNHLRCLDTVGFASIGIGSRHADSQFMFSRFSKEWELPEAMFLAFSAKKRAEVAPGVGKDTDLVVIFPTGADVIEVKREIVDRFTKMYNESVEKDEKTRVEQLKNAKDYINEATQPTTSSERPDEAKTDG